MPQPKKPGPKPREVPPGPREAWVEGSTFVDFVTSLGVEMTPAQRVLYSVAIDGLDPCDTSDPALAAKIFGPVARVPSGARDVVAVVKGARVGGSYFGALYLLWRSLTADLSGLAPGEEAAAIVVAPDKRLAIQTLKYARGAVETVPDLETRVLSEGGQTRDGFTLGVGHGRKVSIEALPASAKGTATRGRSLVAALLDESAFLRDADFQVNDTEIFRSIIPRVMPGGRVLVSSTPWAASGLLHDLFSRNHGQPRDALAAHCPTLLMRPDDRTARIVAAERDRDPDNAAREFDAVPMSGGSSSFFDSSAIDAAIDRERPIVLAPGPLAYVGIDLAFRRDSSALVVVHRRGRELAIAETLELRPKFGRPLKPSEVIEQFAALARRHGAGWVACDGHYLETAREFFAAAGLSVVVGPEGARGKAESYVHLRNVLGEGRLSMPNDPRLAAQLRAITSSPQSGGGLSITAPRNAQGHGDLVSALVLASWAATAAPRSYRNLAALPPA